MKIQISFTVEVNTDKWAETYGINPTEVRQDVKNWAYHQVLQGQAENLIKPTKKDQD